DRIDATADGKPAKHRDKRRSHANGEDKGARYAQTAALKPANSLVPRRDRNGCPPNDKRRARPKAKASERHNERRQLGASIDKSLGRSDDGGKRKHAYKPDDAR